MEPHDGISVLRGSGRERRAEERPCEHTARRWSSISRGASPHQHPMGWHSDPPLPTSRIAVKKLPVVSATSDCGILLGQPEWTRAGSVPLLGVLPDLSVGVDNVVPFFFDL